MSIKLSLLESIFEAIQLGELGPKAKTHPLVVAYKALEAKGMINNQPTNSFDIYRKAPVIPAGAEIVGVLSDEDLMNLPPAMTHTSSNFT
jgi:hypothetical protein